MMEYFHGLNPGDTVNNKGLMNLFDCGISGGMRRAKKNNALVLVSDSFKSTYEDRWIGDIFHYTGMGLVGDQSLNYMQNKTLNESGKNGVLIFLFEVFKEGVYTYRGRVELAGKPYMEDQLDTNKDLRKVWVFPLRLIADSDIVYQPSIELLSEVTEHQEKRARRMPLEELSKRAMHARKSTTTKENRVNVFYRDPYVSEFAKRRANGRCQLCEQAAPFLNKNKEPYLETHHIKWLAKGGEDTVENTVALCPNCHRKMHVLDLHSDVQKLLKIAGGWLVI
ncbi:HNH endonuclease [Paenibacillus aurantiacus]|uniref:HNH endonuclease n=1 Tax=Paenibacillus aurantiacus TaxID=1936118 RepID=A0ABV5KP23_9BACL